VRGQDRVTVRLARREDEEQILEVLVAAFDGWPLVPISVDPVDHLRWKQYSVDGLPNLTVVAEIDSRIASVRLDMARAVEINGNRRLMVLNANSGTHPDFRGRGIYQTLRQHEVASHRDIADMSLGWTFNPVMRHIAENDEKRHAMRNKVLVKVLDIRRMAQNSRGSSGGLKSSALVRVAAFKAADFARRLRPRAAEPSFDGEIRRVDEFDGCFDELWRRAGNFDFVSDRSSAYLNWRYMDERGGQHTVFAAYQDDEVLGYIALLDNEGRGQILDLFTLPNRNDVALKLIQRGVDFFGDAGSYVVECRMAAGNRYESCLIRMGFLDTRRPSNFHYQNERLTTREVETLEGKDSILHLMGGDL